MKNNQQSIFLTPLEAAQLLRVSVQTLAKWRCERRGPAYSKLGGKAVRYQKNDLILWAGVWRRHEKMPRSRINEHGESGEQFLKTFGAQGGVWFAEGKSFEEAKRLHRKQGK